MYAHVFLLQLKYPQHFLHGGDAFPYLGKRFFEHELVPEVAAAARRISGSDARRAIISRMVGVKRSSS